jgi:hypothetical protein
MAVEYGAAHGARAMTTTGNASTARKEAVDNVVAGADRQPARHVGASQRTKSGTRR